MMFDLKVKVSKKTEEKIDDLMKGIIATVINQQNALHGDNADKDDRHHSSRIEQAQSNLKNYFRLCLRQAYDLGLRVAGAELSVSMTEKGEEEND